MTINEFSKFLEVELESIRSTTAYMKSDEVVDDDACDEIVKNTRRIAANFNKLVGGDKSLKVQPPEKLEPSTYQQNGCV